MRCRLATHLALFACSVAALAVPGTVMAADVVVTGTAGNDSLVGTPAAESIYGLEGDDRLDGSAGDDELDGGPGADLVNGGPGLDVASYGGATPVDVTLDGQANDGAVGERDNIGVDVEDVYGGDGADRLVGSADANTLDGGLGNDTVEGGAGIDALLGGAGDDTINARDGEVDRVDCGDGNDRATLDAEDVAVGCESADVGASKVRAVGGFDANFATATVKGSRSAAFLFGLLRVSGAPEGARIVARCTSACGYAQTFVVRKAGEGRELKRRRAISPKSRVRVSVSQPGLVSRWIDYRFVWKKRLVQGKAIRGGCSSDTQGREVIACP